MYKTGSKDVHLAVSKEGCTFKNAVGTDIKKKKLKKDFIPRATVRVMIKRWTVTHGIKRLP